MKYELSRKILRGTKISALAALLLPFGGNGRAETPAQVLFAFDDTTLPLQQGLRLQLVAYRTPLGDSIHSDNRVISAGKPGSPDSAGTNYYPGTVCAVNGELWMWYAEIGDQDVQRHSRMGLAKSTDGYHWEKPNLGLVDYHGDKNNNLIDFPVSTSAFIVFYEPESPDLDRRFKMVFTGEGGLFLCVAYSPDGIRWRESAHNPRTRVKFEPTGGVKWQGAYYVTGQGGVNWSPDGWNRNLVTHMSYDFEHWTEATVMGFRRDPLPPRPTTRRGGNDGEQVHVGAALWNRENVVIGFYGQWHGNPNNDLRWVSIDIGFLISHDALHYAEPIPDFRMIEAAGSIPWFEPYAKPISIYRAPAITQGQGFANVGRETLFWFSIWGAPDQGIHVAHWERDRLGYLQPFVGAQKKPYVISAPIRTGGKPATISLNAAGISADGGFKVTLLDEHFNELPGYAAADCTEPKRAGLRQAVKWGAREQITTTQPMRIRVDFVGPDVSELKLFAVYIDAGQPAGEVK